MNAISSYVIFFSFSAYLEINSSPPSQASPIAAYLLLGLALTQTHIANRSVRMLNSVITLRQRCRNGRKSVDQVFSTFQVPSSSLGRPRHNHGAHRRTHPSSLHRGEMIQLHAEKNFKLALFYSKLPPCEHLGSSAELTNVARQTPVVKWSALNSNPFGEQAFGSAAVLGTFFTTSTCPPTKGMTYNNQKKMEEKSEIRRREESRRVIVIWRSYKETKTFEKMEKWIYKTIYKCKSKEAKQTCS